MVGDIDTPLFYRYLVQGSQGSILHTGDFRAEPSFLKSVAEDPFLKPFLAQGGNQTMDVIDLNTACMIEYRATSEGRSLV